MKPLQHRFPQQSLATVALLLALLGHCAAPAAEDPGPSFRLDVMPILMRSGCNTGSCHGAARGKDGFRLSLFGMDPDGDYVRLTRELT